MKFKNYIFNTKHPKNNPYGDTCSASLSNLLKRFCLNGSEQSTYVIALHMSHYDKI